MTTNQYLSYRGDVRAVANCANSLAFVTVHPEGVPTSLYRLDVAKLSLDEIAMQCGGVSLVATDNDLWIGGDDSRIYHLTSKAKTLKQLKVELPAPATDLAILSGNRIAAICGEQWVIVDAKKGTEAQSFELADKATALASDPTGDWIAIGTSKGNVSVYEQAESGEFQISETEKLHDGAVTSLLFEPEELRFLSAGADQKLLLTHASGKLEPEDRGRGAGHSDHVTAMMHVAGERFISVSRDKSCKTWARAGATRPATFDDVVPVVVDAALIEIHGRPQLVIAGADNTLRFILIDAAGRFGAMTNRVYDAYDRASHLLGTGDVAQRGEALHSLAQYDDDRSIEMVAKQTTGDVDFGLRLRACELLCKSDHPRAAKLLEPLLKHADEKVRLVAFEGLRNRSGKGDLRPLELALKSGQANVGIAAVQSLEPLARKDEQSRQLLIRSFNNDPEEVRRAALLSFENVVAKDSAEPTMLAAKARKPDTRRLGLIRAYQRGLLDDSRIAGTVRRSGEDADADVRRTAFLVALLSREKLAKAIRQRDKGLHRQLFELENFTVDLKKGTKAKEPPALKATNFNLTAGDYDPLLSAMSSRATDTCLLGARCLALLGDSRALGTLFQLSREDDSAARVQVCQALAALADARAAQRLETLVNDTAAEVRDAAYSALEHIHDSDPLEAADIGLKSSHVDVRRRALKTLSTSMQRSKRKTIADRSRELMLRALNDDDDSVSGEAFKTSLGLKIDGTSDATLRFTLNSVRPSVRSEVLTETMAHDKHDWANQLLVDLLDDPSAKIRMDAYEHILKKGKGRDIAPMQAALASRFMDVRLRATESLIKLKTKASQATLLTAIEDEEPAVRQQALDALINRDAVEDIQKAMSSRHTDVRLQAACARAMFHDADAKAPLLETATATEPERDADKAQWQKDAVVALNGLGMLGFEEFVPELLPLLESKHEGIRVGAVSAISRCARPSQIELLTPALQHSDPKVSYRIALGLAFCEEPSVLPVVFSDKASKVLTDKDRLMAAVAYGEKAETHLLSMLDASTTWIRNAAFLVLMIRDWKSHEGSPTRVLSALSTRDARIRLAAAEALEAFAREEAFGKFIVGFVNDRGDDQAWEITADQVAELAEFIVFATPRCQAQMITVLEELASDKQDQWDFAWQVYSTRYADESKAAAKSAKSQRLPKLTSESAELSQLAFGTYVGLVREQGGHGAPPTFGKTVIAVRQEAIRRLVVMAETDQAVAEAVRPVLVQALSDNYQPVRSLAFHCLPRVGCDDASRAAAAIECGHTDLAVEAFKLLSSAGGKKGQQVLEDVILTRDDSLASEAGMLLMKMTDATTAAKAGLESPHSQTRSLAVNWLAGAYDEDAKAKKALVEAYESRYDAVRRDAAIALAVKKDKHAFEMLIEQLPLGLTKNMQFRIINAIAALGDTRSPAALLSALEADEEKSLDPTMVFSIIGSFRQPDIVDRLLPLLQQKQWRSAVATSVVRISGHDQTFDDSEDEDLDRTWMDEQYPRHDDVLASYLDQCIELNLPDLITPSLRAARWSLSDAVDRALPLLCVHPDDSLRNEAVEAVGWRLRKRGGPADALLEALKSRDATTKFLAAEGLARGGRDDGITVLLSAVELMADLRLRRRAVDALGELADQRALEVLLKLVNEDGHALQDSAAAAIGHLGKSEKADEIFDVLKRLANSVGSVSARAIVGLRHLNTPAGWDLIREKAVAEEGNESILIEQLGYNDSPETRQLLLDKMKYWADAALPAAKRLFGDQSLEPDYAALASEYYYVPSEINDRFRCLERVCDDGDAKRILEILPDSDCRDELAAALMKRDPLPIEAAVDGLDSVDPLVVEVAAAIVGRAGEKKRGEKLGPAISHWSAKWEQQRLDRLRASDWYTGANDDISRTLCRLAWAVGRTGIGKNELVELLGTHLGIPEFANVRRAASVAIGDTKLTKAELTRLEKLLGDNDASVRRAVAEIVAREDSERAGKHAAELLPDRSAFRRLDAHQVDVSGVAVDHADHPHYQAIVLPSLVASGEEKRLSDVAMDKDLGEATRLGAVEGLARIANKDADKHLVSIGKDAGSGEELQKAAWRGLRRSQRMQAKAK